MTEPDDLSPLIAGWPGEPALIVGDRTRILGAAGDLDRAWRVASITKLFTAYACLVAIEEGTITLDDAAGPEGSTVRHLLGHAAGYAFDGDDPITGVESRRIYSNTGIETVANHLAARAGMAFADYLHEGVLAPIGLGHLALTGSPAHALHASLNDLVVFAREVLDPTIVARETLAMATTPSFPDLRGVLPGFGVFDHNLWGLGFEIRGDKQPHWTAPTQPSHTFGHFGGSGSFLWIDAERGLFAASQSLEPFGEWAVENWPVANEAIFARYS